jgi:hypothetical protein
LFKIKKFIAWNTEISSFANGKQVQVSFTLKLGLSYGAT